MIAKRQSRVLWLMIWGCLAGFAGCGRDAGMRVEGTASARIEGIDRSLSSAARFLVERQDADGGWRSDQYAPFRDGSALTPLGMHALRWAADLPEFASAYRNGSEYLARRVKPDGIIDEGPHGFSYPVYTSALAVRVLSE